MTSAFAADVHSEQSTRDPGIQYKGEIGLTRDGEKKYIPKYPSLLLTRYKDQAVQAEAKNLTATGLDSMKVFA